MFRTSFIVPVVALFAAATPALADDPGQLKLELIIVNDGEELRGFAYSSASGPNVETAGLVADGLVATGAIASVGPVESIETETGFDLYSSQVGTTTR
ncbi:hypothetical protein [Pelagovum pacificum]|uniref:Uncharacterized protein n=1 Tax=Pelagovum pacificum TaxID=2588711 RepID=A0A5C5GDV7_9RHOB|nr:hypothetical protein [Pelagovum pacificum]QQA43907.1 hypothetical protein I8N54_04825 [Pelagovum pacificum]TNY32962.1 hypothetical protein FHY64_06715 [Pelagovum pacificum]